MLAHGIERNIFFYDHIAVFHMKRLTKMLFCIFFVTSVYFLAHSGDPIRCFDQAFSVGVFSDPFQ